MDDTVLFWKETAANGFLSNFYPAPTEAFGLKGPTSEHVFQALKFFHDPEAGDYINDILGQNTPNKAACLGRMKCPFNYNWAKPLKESIAEAIEAGITIDPDWEDLKDWVMEEVVTQKFLQNPKLVPKLLDTGEAELIEHTKDAYWGDGINGSGRNQLGIILMRVRDRLRSRSEPKLNLPDGFVLGLDWSLEEAEDLREHDLGLTAVETQESIYLVNSTLDLPRKLRKAEILLDWRTQPFY